MPVLAADDEDFFDAAGGALVGLGLGGVDLAVGVAALVGGINSVPGMGECFASRAALRTAWMGGGGIQRVREREGE